MKTLLVECKFVIEVPWDFQEDSEEGARFRIEENSCPGTGPVDAVLEGLMKAANKNDICWACAVGGESKLLAIEDRPPRDYPGEINFKTTKQVDKCWACGSEVAVKVKTNASIVKTSYHCAKCGGSDTSMSMYAHDAVAAEMERRK